MHGGTSGEGAGTCQQDSCTGMASSYTHVQAELYGVLPVQQQAFAGLQRSAVKWNNRLIQAAAVCNGLTWVNRTAVVGEEVELSLYRLAEARFLVSLTRKDLHISAH